ncbi:MAG: hypothetical protein ACI4IV_01540, partial [Acutalibacteraceae bacterium]
MQQSSSRSFYAPRFPIHCRTAAKRSRATDFIGTIIAEAPLFILAVFLQHLVQHGFAALGNQRAR